MSRSPLHPAMVHLPLALSFLMPFLALGVLFMIRSHWVTRRAWLAIVFLQALVFASGFAALQTGQNEEHKTVTYVGSERIGAHNQKAQTFLWASAVTLAAGVVAVVFLAGRFFLLCQIALVAGTIITAALGVITGQSGGELVYRYHAADAYTSDVSAVDVGRDLDLRRDGKAKAIGKNED